MRPRPYAVKRCPLEWLSVFVDEASALKLQAAIAGFRWTAREAKVSTGRITAGETGWESA
jgi:hypothetical protein